MANFKLLLPVLLVGGVATTVSPGGSASSGCSSCDSVSTHEGASSLVKTPASKSLNLMQLEKALMAKMVSNSTDVLLEDQVGIRLIQKKISREAAMCKAVDFEVTSLRNNDKGACRGKFCTQISEFKVYDGSGTELDLKALAAVASADGGNSPSRERPAQAIDGNVNTKWLDFDFKIPLHIEFTEPVEIGSYGFSTANDAPDRDPVSWQLSCSEDGGEMEVIDVVENFETPTQRRAAMGEPQPIGGGTGDDNTGTGDDNTGTGDDNTGTGDDNTGTGEDNTGTADDNTGTGDDTAAAGCDYSSCLSQEDRDTFLAAHNKYRCMHGSALMTWSDAVAEDAARWCDSTGGVMKHDDSYSVAPPAGPAGENIAKGQQTAEAAVDAWYSEVNDCPSFPGCESAPPGPTTGHFTCMIWNGATELGCAWDKPNNWFVCRYKAGDSLSCETPNMGGCYEANVFEKSTDDC